MIQHRLLSPSGADAKAGDPAVLVVKVVHHDLRGVVVDCGDVELLTVAGLANVIDATEGDTQRWLDSVFDGGTAHTYAKE